MTEELKAEIERLALERWPVRMISAREDFHPTDYNEESREIWIAGATTFAERLERLKQDFEQEQFTRAMDGVSHHEQVIHLKSELILQKLGVTWDDIDEVLCGSKLMGPIEFVDGPRGRDNEEETSRFKRVFVDQHSIGDSGDSFAGFIYVQVHTTWIKIPYEC